MIPEPNLSSVTRPHGDGVAIGGADHEIARSQVARRRRSLRVKAMVLQELPGRQVFRGQALLLLLSWWMEVEGKVCQVAFGRCRIGLRLAALSVAGEQLPQMLFGPLKEARHQGVDISVGTDLR